MPRGTEQEASISDEHLSTVSGKISEVAKVLQSLDCTSFPGGLSTQVISNSRALGPYVIWAPMLFLNSSTPRSTCSTVQLSSSHIFLQTFTGFHWHCTFHPRVAACPVSTSPRSQAASAEEITVHFAPTLLNISTQSTQQCQRHNSPCPATSVGKRDHSPSWG